MNNPRSKWFFYGVALVSGLTLAAMLLVSAWQGTLQDNHRDFAFESSRIKEIVIRNIQLSDDVINSVSTLVMAHADDGNKIFRSFVSNILQQHDFISGLFYANLRSSSHDINPILDIDVHTSEFRYTQPLVNVYDLVSDKNLISVLRTLSFEREKSTTAFMLTTELQQKYYVLLQILPIESVLDTQNLTTQSSEQAWKFFCLLINPQKIIKVFDIPDTLSVNLYSESFNLDGRKLIFSNTSFADENITASKIFLVSDLHKNTAIRFPSYSINFSVSKKIFWSDIEYDLLYIALLIGIGVTFLLVALVRAKELREQELRERNQLIGLQVQEQTKELAMARDKAEEATHIKSEFLASMSHEIRTPLTAIIGMAESLADTKLDKDQTRYVNVFKKAGDMLMSLVNDILDLSKIEANQLVLESVSFDLLELIEETIEIYAIKAIEQHIELISHIDLQLGMQRVGDPARLRQIILNLISNAIKFTESGEVLVSVNRYREDELYIAVSDTGIGIAKEKQDQIFSSFMQADSSTTRKYGGTGLGLTISKRLVEMMGGSMWLESEEGVGSTFTFTISLPISDLVGKYQSQSKNILRNNKILILDHNKSHRTKICNIAEWLGAQCYATEELQYSNEFTTYQHILIDYKILLQCNDDQLAKFMHLLQSHPDVNLIAMLSPVSLHQQITRINDVGISNYLVKPIKQSELLSVLLYEDDLPETGVANNNIAEQSDRKKRILLVEDNEDNRLLIKTYLKGQPYMIDEAENGEIAVKLYNNNDYALILMDIQMPVMDGRVATQAIRVLEVENARSPTPIVALTAHAIKEEIDKCIEVGCDTYVGKPIKKSVLLGVVEEFIS